MHTKVLEIRDIGTLIPVLVTSVSTQNAFNYTERGLLERAGFGQIELVMVTRLVDGKGNYDPYQWGDRTMQTAHKYIQDNFCNLNTGSVIDVEFILGETKEPKTSEIL